MSIGKVDVAVIGAGQAGLSAAYHLQRRGLAYKVFDAEEGPGGAWRHRWKSLRMATVNGISDLPGIAKPEVDPAEPSSEFLTRYFAGYERELGLEVLRPVKVASVEREDTDPAGRLRISTSGGDWSAKALINATGTWTRPFWPIYPGRSTFRGRQLHVADYVSAEEFRGLHVIVVGGGISAVGLLDEISQVTGTSWFTRREPEWRDATFDAQAGHDAVALVEERVRQGLPPQSVVAVTGLIRTPALRAAAARGALDRRRMFTSIEPDGVRLTDGSLHRADVILWATGFRAELEHLAPLHLVGYGPSSSTIGANRAGRAAVRAILRLPALQHQQPTPTAPEQTAGTRG